MEEISFRGWIAKDDASDKYYPKTHLFTKEPQRKPIYYWGTFHDPVVWESTDDNGKITSYEFKKLFPDLTFKDKPVEVEVIIRPIKK